MIAESIATSIQQLALEHVIMPVLLSILAAISTWIATQWQKYTGQKIDQKHQESYQLALANAIKQSLQKLIADGKMSVDDKVVPAEHVESVLNDAGIYVQSKVPDAVNHFGVTFDGIKKSLVAKLPLPFDIK